jgi:Protein of unknown function (DUF3611)
MPDRSESQSHRSEQARRLVAPTFRLTGWISFWIQVVLGVISTVVLLLYAAFSRNTPPNTPAGATSNPGTGVGVFFAICGLLILGASIFMAFRYTRIARALLSSQPPRRADTIKVLRMGLLVNLAGMSVTLLGAYAIVGTLVAKSISTQAIAAPILDPSRIISGLDMLAVQANTNTIAGHFAGIVATLWLLNRITKKEGEK